MLYIKIKNRCLNTKTETELLVLSDINMKGCAPRCIPQRVPWTQTPFS